MIAITANGRLHTKIFKYVTFNYLNFDGERDSVTETIPPIVAAKTLKVFDTKEARVKRVR